jgi:primase-polymerase (primpol)-like protein
MGRMNRAIKKIAKWAQSQGWTVEDDASGYTRFYDPQGNYVARYPATPSNPRRRMAELEGKLNESGLQLPPPSKKEQRAKRHHDDQKRTRR